MIKFWTSPYVLNPVQNAASAERAAKLGLPAVVPGFGSPPLKDREGVLLKVEWPNSKVGYADLCPWPEFGDATLQDQLHGLAKGRLTFQLEQSIWMAKRDALFRSKGKNAFAGAAKVKNHFLVPDLAKFTESNMREVRDNGFTTLKIKVGHSVDDEAKMIVRLLRQNPITVRLDFNSRVDFSQFERFLSHFGPSDKPKIEFVEDPMPWDPEAWKEAAKFATLAADFEAEKIKWDELTEKPPFSILVLKPSRQDVDKTLKWVNQFALKLVITSSLDHPVGNAHAYWVATEIKKFYPNTLLDCGCLTMRAYQATEFSNRILTVGPYLKDIAGTGVGFDDLLTRILWLAVPK